VNQHLAARGPFPALALDMIHLKANILQEIAKDMLREAEEIVWFLMHQRFSGEAGRIEIESVQL